MGNITKKFHEIDSFQFMSFWPGLIMYINFLKKNFLIHINISVCGNLEWLVGIFRTSSSVSLFFAIFPKGLWFHVFFFRGPTKEILVEYRAKVDFLMKILETRANTTKTTNVKKSVDVVDVAGGTRRRSVRSSSPPSKFRSQPYNKQSYADGHFNWEVFLLLLNSTKPKKLN